jgi:hypothetical protein
MAGEDTNRDDYVYSEKIVTSESEKGQDYSADEKYVHDGEEYQESHLQDSKERKLDAEHQLAEYLDNEDELDIAIINEIATIDDDTNMRCLTFRSMLVGCVSSIPHTCIV